MFTTKFFQASFAAALVLVSLSASSQSMTQPNLPNHGFTFTYGVTTSQPSGFDWSTETSIQNVEFAFVPADSSAYGDAFPEADFSQQIVAATGGLTEQFYAYNEEGMDFWGFVDGATGLQVTHPEAIQFIPYPYAAGDIHSDSLEFEFMANGLSVFRRQILQQEVLESGTLTLPNELSFEGALRVDATQSVYDSTVTGASELLIVGEMYWVQDMPLHVAATYDYYQIVGVDTTLAFSGAEFVVDAATGLELPTQASLKAFPSPAVSQLTVEAQAGDWIRVTDIQGRMLDRRQLSANRETWDVSGWPTGLAFLNIEGTSTTRRIVVTH